MARRNILDYRDVLSFLISSNKVAPDGCVSLHDIVEAFVIKTDKCRADTIMQHVEYMCGLRLLQRRGEVTYKIIDTWESTLDKIR